MRLRDAKKHRSGFGGDIDAPQIARDYQIAAASAAIKAGGVTSRPSLRNGQAPTSIFSRRSATSHRMVASEPVIEKFGPRSTPIRMALTTEAGR